jgi:hypothetical protein
MYFLVYLCIFNNKGLKPTKKNKMKNYTTTYQGKQYPQGQKPSRLGMLCITSSKTETGI